jgi:hypothetical protein
MAIVTSPKLLINKFVKERKNPKAADKQESKKKGTDAIRSVPITTGEHRQLKSRTLEANLLGGRGPDFQQEAIFTPHFSSILPERKTQPTTQNGKKILREWMQLNLRNLERGRETKIKNCVP